MPAPLAWQTWLYVVYTMRTWIQLSNAFFYSKFRSKIGSMKHSRTNFSTVEEILFRGSLHLFEEDPMAVLREPVREPLHLKEGRSFRYSVLTLSYVPNRPLLRPSKGS